MSVVRTVKRWDGVDGELSYQPGQTITVTEKDSGGSGWWVGKLPDGKVGLFPSNTTDGDLFSQHTPKRNVGAFYRMRRWKLSAASSASSSSDSIEQPPANGLQAPPPRSGPAGTGVARQGVKAQEKGKWKGKGKGKGKGKWKGKGKGKWNGKGKGKWKGKGKGKWKEKGKGKGKWNGKGKGKRLKSGSHKRIKVKKRVTTAADGGQQRLPSRAPPKRDPSVEDVAPLLSPGDNLDDHSPAPLSVELARSPGEGASSASRAALPAVEEASSEDDEDEDIPLDRLARESAQDGGDQTKHSFAKSEDDGPSEPNIDAKGDNLEMDTVELSIATSGQSSEPNTEPTESDGREVEAIAAPPASAKTDAQSVAPKQGVPLLQPPDTINILGAPPSRPTAPKRGSKLLLAVDEYNKTHESGQSSPPPRKNAKANLERFLASPTQFSDAQMAAAASSSNLLGSLDLGSAGTPKKKKKKRSKKSKYRKGTKRIPATRSVEKPSHASPLLSELYSQIESRNSPAVNKRHSSLRNPKSPPVVVGDNNRRRALSRSASRSPPSGPDGTSPPLEKPLSQSLGTGLAAQRAALAQSPKSTRRRSRGANTYMTMRVKKTTPSSAGWQRDDSFEEEEESESSVTEESDESPDVSEEELQTSLYGLDLETASPSRFAAPAATRVERQRASHEKNFRKKMIRNQPSNVVERAAVIALAERKRMLHQYAFCGEQLESHTMFHRTWADDSMDVPEIKEKRKLIGCPRGLFHLEFGKRAICSVPDFAHGDIGLEDPDFYKRHFNDFIKEGPHVYYLCIDAKLWKEYSALLRKKRKKSAGLRKGSSRNVSPEQLKAKLIEKTYLLAVRGAPEAHYMLIFKRFSLGRLAMPYNQVSIKDFLTKQPNFADKEVLTLEPGFNAKLDEHVGKWELYGCRHHLKIGVLYAKNGQNVEEEVYSNQQDSVVFKHFLMLLGNVVSLNGFSGYRGGLNVKENSTGIFSVANRVTFAHDGKYVYDETKQQAKQPKHGGGSRNSQDITFHYELMFHVSTFLPFTPENPQQLAKKRHIGNDIVVIIFKDKCDGDDSVPFQPEILTSPWIWNDSGVLTHYKVAVASKGGVKPFRPYLPKNGIISKRNLTTWLLLKCINGERAALYENEFARKEQRTNISQMKAVFDIVDQQLQRKIFQK